MTTNKKQDPRETLEDLIRAAKRAGADAADALIVESIASSVSYRMGELEDVERAESADLGLRVFVGQRVSFVMKFEPDGVTLTYSTLFGADGETVARAIAIDANGDPVWTLNANKQPLCADGSNADGSQGSFTCQVGFNKVRLFSSNLDSMRELAEQLGYGPINRQ